MNTIIDEINKRIDQHKHNFLFEPYSARAGKVDELEWVLELLEHYIAAQSPDLTAVTPANGEALPCAGCVDMDCDGCKVKP